MQRDSMQEMNVFGFEKPEEPPKQQKKEKQQKGAEKKERSEKKEETKEFTSNRMNVTSYNHSVLNAEDVSRKTGKSRSHDRIIKDLLTNARFTGFLLTRIIPEMKGVTLDQFCEYTNTDPDTGGDLKQQATELGSASTKDVRLDLVFEYDAASKLLLRINEEPQTSQEAYSKTNKDSYSLVARAAYYASLAMVTGIHSEEEYHWIRKVYSVWICFARPIPSMREPIISYGLKPDEDYKYVDGTSLSSSKRKFDNGDLMGIILISVPDLENFVAKGKAAGKYSQETLEELYTLLSNDISYDNRKEFYHDTVIVKEGFEMRSSVSTIERTLEKERQLDERANQLDERANQFDIEKQQFAEEKVVRTVIKLSNEIGWSDDTIIQKIAEQLEVTQEEAENLFELYSL